MSVECPADIFKQFEDGCGGYVSPVGEGFEFMYEARSEGEYLGLIWLDIADLDDKSFNDWKHFESWCNNIEPELMWEIVDEESFENPTPKDYFKSKTAIEEKVISLLCDSERMAEGAELVCVEIESKNKKLFLIYDDQLAWHFEAKDSVLVLESLDELTPENGWYLAT
jgi:hypothetical protein|tara:strand:+ start:146 stop:649 length:504 start_codon:yes stop_codon:yes gene_type:complete